MAIVQINKYVINYRTEEQEALIKIYYKLQDTDVSEIVKIKNREDLNLVIEMLRYEKPVFWATSSKVIMTGPEEVGEEES